MSRKDWELNVLFVLTARFPTTKAYGVTTYETMKALSRLGHEAEIISLRNLHETQKSRRVGRELKAETNSVSSKKFTRLHFNMLRFKIFILATKLYRGRIDLVWLREPQLALLAWFLINSAIIVIEIHQRQKYLNKTIIKILIKQKRVVICPIKLSLGRDFRSAKGNMVPAPMSVNSNFLFEGSKRTVSDKGSFNKVIYIGNISNRWQEECFLYFLRNTRLLAAGPEVESITILGVSKDWFKEKSLDYFLKNSKFRVLGHVSHSEITNLLEPGMIAVLSYYDNDYFRDTFPIKAVEYAALKVPIIASDTEAHRELFEPGCVKYFDMNVDNLDLSESVLEMIQNSAESEAQAQRAFNWARNFTYENRARAILNEVKQRLAR